MIKFDDDEKALIVRLSVPNGWDDDEAKALRTKIKNYLRGQGIPCCCYCRHGMNGWHSMTIDVEHVLPKQKNAKFNFDLRNLGLSCKRCNMTIKGSDESFYLGTAEQKELFRSADYSFIHPTVDKYDDHLEFLFVQRNDKFFVKYTVINGSEKAIQTRVYFQLDALEADTLDGMQGLVSKELSSSTPAEVIDQIREAVKSIEAS